MEKQLGQQHARGHSAKSESRLVIAVYPVGQSETLGAFHNTGAVVKTLEQSVYLLS